jgi:hypothetical protein
MMACGRENFNPRRRHRAYSTSLEYYTRNVAPKIVFPNADHSLPSLVEHRVCSRQCWAEALARQTIDPADSIAAYR